MTERVQFNMERMIPELEDYKNRGIFSSNELKKIIETRRKYEFRLQRPEKKLLDIIRYIKSECTLEKIRDRRLRDRNVGGSFYDTTISNKIIGLYRTALYKFNDPKIVAQFSNYVIRKKMYTEMKDIFAECCSRNPLDVDLWIYCAGKLFDVGDIESYRAMFLKGLRMNSKSSRMRIEFFRMEVAYVRKMEMLNKEMGLDEDEKDEVERGELAFVVFLEYFDSSCLSGEGLAEILAISKAVRELNERIEKYVEENYP